MTKGNTLKKINTKKHSKKHNKKYIPTKRIVLSKKKLNTRKTTRIKKNRGKISNKIQLGGNPITTDPLVNETATLLIVPKKNIKKEDMESSSQITLKDKTYDKTYDYYDLRQTVLSPNLKSIILRKLKENSYYQYDNEASNWKTPNEFLSVDEENDNRNINIDSNLNQSISLNQSSSTKEGFLEFIKNIFMPPTFATVTV